MSTMLSSRRFVEPVRPAVAAEEVKAGDRGLSLAVKAMVGGFIGLAAGAHFEVEILMAAGFLFLATAGLYLNGRFWAHMESKGHFKPGNFQRHD